ncbi:MAG: hypothetical protein RLP44_30075 [Aggregatilineales bacterium]
MNEYTKNIDPIFVVSPFLRKAVVFGAPLLTVLLLVLHPAGMLTEPTATQPATQYGAYAFIAGAADRFVLVHLLFAPMIALMGLALLLIIRDQQGVAATISRVSVFVFVVMYIVYETIIGTASSFLVRSARSLPLAEQSVIAEMVNRLWTDPVFGDGGLISVIAILAWAVAVTSAAVSLYRSGGALSTSLLLGFAFIFGLHAPPTGPLGQVLFLVAVWQLERPARTKVVNKEQVAEAVAG